MLEFTQRRMFERLVRAHAADLYRFAYWLSRDRFAAEELVQETCARAWKHFHELRDTRAEKAWLFTILRRENARRFERKRLSIVVDRDVDDGSVILEAVGFLSPDDDRSAVRDAIANLAPTLAEPLLLQVLGGFDCREIAAMLGTSEGAITTRVCRARAQLRQQLAPSVAPSNVRGPR